jgi:hypothetical protein
MQNLQALTQPDSPALTRPGSALMTPSGSPLTDEDRQLAVFAREALLQDGILGPLNLGVTVRSGVATLWGTVPTIALARRADERVRSVPGLAQVKNDLRIIADDDATAEFLGRPAFQSPAVRGEQAKRRDRAIPLVSQESSPRLGRTSAISPPIMPPVQIPAGPARSISSFEPPEPLSPFHGRRDENTEGAMPISTVSAPSPLVEALENLRRSNERFRPIRFQLRGAFVQLWGNGANSSDVFSFAQQVSHMSGVQRVIVEHW